MAETDSADPGQAGAGTPTGKRSESADVALPEANGTATLPPHSHLGSRPGRSVQSVLHGRFSPRRRRSQATRSARSPARIPPPDKDTALPVWFPTDVRGASDTAQRRAEQTKVLPERRPST